MDSIQKNKLLEQLTQSLELPDTAYEKAVSRYEDLGAWLDREDSTFKHNKAQIFPQGSFRLGTAIKPINETESYDLDLACNIRAGFATNTHSQKNLKDAVGKELESYRVARNIKAEKESKHRCWRLEYADDVSFHLDIVPCIPQSENVRQTLTESMQKYGLNLEVASNLSKHAVCITDDTLPHYSTIADDWPISNPEGYALWFIDKMRTRSLLEDLSKKAQIDDIPVFKRKTPLQRVVQLLKRHRDVMFQEHSDSKPISIIIATIAANAYSGSRSLEVALQEVLTALNTFASSNSDKVLNPVNPDENFADKWESPNYADLRLKENFKDWVREANRHFSIFLSSDDVQRIYETASDNFKVGKSKNEWANLLGISIAPSIVTTSRDIEHAVAKPWGTE